MTDQFQVEPIGGVRRLPVVEFPQEAQSVARPGGASLEGWPERVERISTSEQPQDAATSGQMSDKTSQFLAQLSPVRFRFLVDQQKRAVRVRIIDTVSGEIIREVPPGDQTRPPEPPEHL